VFCHLVVLVRLSVPVQVIDWKDSSPMGMLNPTHSLTHSLFWRLLQARLVPSRYLLEQRRPLVEEGMGGWEGKGTEGRVCPPALNHTSAIDIVHGIPHFEVLACSAD